MAPVILAIWGSKQEDCGLKASLALVVRTYFKKEKRTFLKEVPQINKQKRISVSRRCFWLTHRLITRCHRTALCTPCVRIFCLAFDDL